jgi:hypothetical protein
MGLGHLGECECVVEWSARLSEGRKHVIESGPTNQQCMSSPQRAWPNCATPCEFLSNTMSHMTQDPSRQFGKVPSYGRLISPSERAEPSHTNGNDLRVDSPKFFQHLTSESRQQDCVVLEYQYPFGFHMCRNNRLERRPQSEFTWRKGRIRELVLPNDSIVSAETNWLDSPTSAHALDAPPSIRT